MNVLSLFDGMSCLKIALTELGIKHDVYYASEIDNHAIKQTQLNFPNTVQLGSVTDWQTWDIDWSKIGLIGAGSPCQGFSFAGKQLAFDDPRSKLFFVFIDILNHCRKFNPNVKFLLENVDMKREHMKVINEFTGVFPVNINSNLVSAQNRNRWYWSNIKTKTVGLFGEVHTDIPQPKDRGILLKDILEKEVPEKYYLSDKMLNYFDKRAANFNAGKVNIRAETDKASTLCASMSSCDISDNFVIDTNGRIDDKKTGTLTARYGKGADNYSSNPFILDTKLKPKENQTKANCFTAGGNSGGLHSDMDLIVEKKVIQINESLESGGKQPYQQNRVYDSNGIFPALMTEYRGNVQFKNRIRRLTPTECARLQTIPEWYKWECSDTQIYRMLGNGFTIKVIMHILSHNDWTACK